MDSDGVTLFDLGRKPTVTAKILFCTLEDTTGNAGPFRAVDSVMVDVDLSGTRRNGIQKHINRLLYKYI